MGKGAEPNRPAAAGPRLLKSRFSKISEEQEVKRMGFNYAKEKRQFDTVILDPPAFCKTADEIKDAYRGYKDINLNAIKIVKSGGFLITCSCSHYMSASLFEKC